MKVWMLMIQSNSMIPQVLDDPKGISIGSIDFEIQMSSVIPPSAMVLFFSFVTFGKFII